MKKTFAKESESIDLEKKSIKENSHHLNALKFEISVLQPLLFYAYGTNNMWNVQLE